jgi:hypothetical protein
MCNRSSNEAQAMTFYRVIYIMVYTDVQSIPLKATAMATMLGHTAHTVQHGGYVPK